MINRPILLVPFPSEHDYLREAMIGIGEFVRQHTDWALRRVDVDRDLPLILRDSGTLERLIGVIAFAALKRLETRLKPLKVPQVNISARRATTEMYRVMPDSFRVGESGAEHLLGAGLTQLGYVGNSKLFYSNERGRGFTAGAEAADVRVLRHNFSDDETLEQWLLDCPKPIGVMCCNDSIASYVVDAAFSAGLDVPRDVAVLGADDSLVWCATARVALSSVPTEGRRVGFTAAKLIQSLNQGQPPPTEAILIAPHRVAARESTDYIPIEDQRVVDALRYLRTTAYQGLTVGKIVKQMGLTRRTFDRQVTTALGRTPHDELERLRMERALELLIESTLSNSEIAKRSGFNQPGYFMRVFRRATGMTPSQYRKKYRDISPNGRRSDGD
ncbi:MAG: substrate-binding domain-containing protein [Phycisphaeraceae bacterium]|nr:substrate-binding domain-containing protein [Phycisphaeraceae bacterium]